MALYAIKNCEFVFNCPREWEQLQPTEMYDVKWCEMCWRKVHLCDDDFLLELHTKAENCVAVFDPSGKEHYLGGPVIAYQPVDQLN